jgi:hypothetical protein
MTMITRLFNISLVFSSNRISFFIFCLPFRWIEAVTEIKTDYSIFFLFLVVTVDDVFRYKRFKIGLHDANLCTIRLEKK